MEFNLQRYLHDININERNHWDDFKRLQEIDEVDAIFKDMQFKECKIKQFDPDTPVIVGELNGRTFNRYSTISENYYQRTEDTERCVLEKQNDEPVVMKTDKKEEKCEMKKTTTPNKLTFDQILERHLYKPLSNTMYAMYPLDSDHVIYVFIIELKENFQCICIGFDNMAYAVADHLYDKVTETVFCHMYDCAIVLAGKHFLKYTDKDGLQRVFEWLREIQEELVSDKPNYQIIKHVGDYPMNDRFYHDSITICQSRYCIEHNCYKCIFRQYCINAHTYLWLTARVHEFDELSDMI